MRGCIALVSLALAGCSGSPRASSVDMDASLRPMIACLQNAARTLDDQRSDVTGVAYGLIGACDSEIRNTIAVAGQGMTFDNQQTLRVRLNQEYLKMASSIVLEERAKRAGARS